MTVLKMIIRVAAMGALAVNLPVFASNDFPSNWKSECVGRMQLSLPVDVDVAATTLTDWKRKWVPASSSFTDEEISWDGHLVYLGNAYVIHGLTSDGLNTFMKNGIESREKFRTKFQNAKDATKSYKELTVAPQDGYGFQAQGQRYMYLRLGKNAFVWSGYGEIADEEALHNFEVIANGLRNRGAFEVPREDGVCLPYAFIKDNGSEKRNIAMTFRLKSHPDVTVRLEDSSAATYTDSKYEKNAKPEHQINDFWRQYEIGPTGKLVGSLWETPKLRHIELDGQNGLASFVQIKRQDDSIDYGYFAVVRGDPKAKQDTPDLQLHVIREATHAKAKGIEPISKKEFLEMAQAIAASVKHRPNGQN
ncbi:MAG: T6SS immunity protein Tli4 family protein [Burkholderiaceae bacterium]